MATRHGRARKGSIVKRFEKDEKGHYVLDKKARRRVKAIFARVTFVDRDGKRKDRLQRAESESDATEKIGAMLREVDDRGEKALDDRDRTFDDLCNYFEKHYLTEAEYNEHGQKESGLRSLDSAQLFFGTLKAHFGRYRLHDLSIEDVRAFRKLRRNTPTRADIGRHKRALKTNRKAQIKSTRTTASINRELSLLRRMLNVAVGKDWIRRNPIAGLKGRDTLISTANEKQRERIITIDEEQRLLKACAEPYVMDKKGEYVLTQKGEKRIKPAGRGDLQAIIVCALDTGMRRGEILSLRWSDIDFAKRLITIRAFNAKTARERQVAMTSRLGDTLEKLWEKSDRDSDARVFGVDSVKKSFDSARREAGLPDVRFHDLRHTVASRLISRQVPLPEVGRLLGHALPSTTYRYANVNHQSLRRAAQELEAFNHDGPSGPTAIESDAVN